ncbi:MAG: phosphoribosylglycinamide formyltransferase [Gammaproteobacteria bacterium]
MTASPDGIGTGPRTVVMISGGGTNLQAIINEVEAGEVPINLCAVVCDRAGVLGLERAERAGIPTHVVDYADIDDRDRAERRLAECLRDIDPELVVLAGFMRILPTAIVEAFTGRMLNIHPSLLPKFRGLNTYRRAVDAGERWHGTTVHFVIPELDAGPSIIQYRVAVHPDETVTSLQARVQQGEYLIYPRAVGWFGAGRLRLRDGEVWLDGLPLSEPVVIDEQ